MNATILRLIFLSIFLLSHQTQAADDLNLPVSLEVQRQGAFVAPIIQCPRSKKKYDDLLDQLGSIKDQIKKDACKQEEVDAINDVETLEKLVGPERKKFLALLSKGQGDGELTESEVGDLKTYIDKVVKKTAVIAGLANNPACFDEGKKASVLGVLSSVIGEVSGAIGAVAGPLGAKISLGGKLAAGLLSSIDSIVQARKTYEFSDYEQEKAYLSSLCAYYDFKPDLEKETNTGTIIYGLENLIENAEKLLDRLGEECQECRGIIEDFESKVENDVPYRLTQNPAGQGVDRVVTKSVVEMSWRDLNAFYLHRVSDADESVEVAKDRNGPGTHTIRTLRTKTWAIDEMEKLKQLDRESLSDSGRDAVIEVQDQIENVLVKIEGPKYINHLTIALSRSMGLIRSEAQKAWQDLTLLSLQPDPNRDYGSRWTDSTDDIIHDLFRDDIDFTQVVTRYTKPEDVEKSVNDGKLAILKAVNRVRSDYAVLRQRCNFYKFSSLPFDGRLETSCSRANSRMKVTVDFFANLESTNFSAKNSYLLEVFKEEDKNFTKDWVDSTAALLVHMLNKEDLVKVPEK